MSRILVVVTFGISSILFLSSCKHSPLAPTDDLMEQPDPMEEVMDTTDMTNTDTTNTGSILEPCDPDKIYFNQQVLPILKTNCALSGCHDAESAEDGVILVNYQSVIETADVEAFNLDDSELYEVLVDDDEAERMPPAPANRLHPDNIQIIAQWILQGGELLECEEQNAVCDTLSVSFAQTVQPIIRSQCESCHSGNNPSGGIDLASYETIKSAGEGGRLIGAIAWLEGFKMMPQGGDQLAPCTIDQISAWVNAGAPNN